MDKTTRALLQSLPAVGVLMTRREVVESRIPKWALGEAIRATLEQARERALLGECPEESRILAEALSLAEALARPRLRRVINATGTLVHTNLGRSPLSRRALERVAEVASSYSNLEYDLRTGARGSRHGIVDGALCRLTGAEAAMVVNNNAAAVLLALSELARGKEVVVSRGELVEIGGSFRIPDIITQSGCRLVEVGTTNRTRLSDYARAIGLETALLLKVHPSNYRIMGFTESVDASALTALARERGLLVMEDLGSGCLVNLQDAGLSDEYPASVSVDAGIDLVTMSGDKLLGGPQAGILVGKSALIERCRKHPLARALRVDKLCLAALEGTLHSYLEHQERAEVPVLAALTRSTEALERIAREMADALATESWLEVGVVMGGAMVGGGAHPVDELPGPVVQLRVARSGSARVSDLERYLRRLEPPVIVRVKEGFLLLDPRSLLANEPMDVVEAIKAYRRGGSI